MVAAGSHQLSAETRKAPLLAKARLLDRSILRDEQKLGDSRVELLAAFADDDKEALAKARSQSDAILAGLDKLYEPLTTNHKGERS